MRRFEVAEVRGHIEGQKVAHWQVIVRIGFTLDEWAPAEGFRWWRWNLCGAEVSVAGDG